MSDCDCAERLPNSAFIKEHWRSVWLMGDTNIRKASTARPPPRPPPLIISAWSDTLWSQINPFVLLTPGRHAGSISGESVESSSVWNKNSDRSGSNSLLCSFDAAVLAVDSLVYSRCSTQEGNQFANKATWNLTWNQLMWESAIRTTFEITNLFFFYTQKASMTTAMMGDIVFVRTP